MNKQEAIKTIKANYPPKQYTMLRKALDVAIDELARRDQDSISKSKMMKWLESKRIESMEGVHIDHMEAIEQVMQEIRLGKFYQDGEEE